jgi:excisionase family DNA binding protein
MNTASTIQTNSNNTFPLPNNLEQYIEEVIEFRLNNTLLYRVQCVTCEECGVLLSVDTDTIREWIKGGKLNASKPGREWVIRVMDIDRMLTSNANVINLSDKRFKRNRKAS